MTEVIQFALWLICLALAPTMMVTLGPLAGLIATVVASGVWIIAGPRPLPGLIPGIMTITVFLANAVYAIHCVRLLL